MPQREGKTLILCSAAIPTSRSNPDQSNLTTEVFRGWTALQYRGNRTLRIPASCISSKSAVVRAFCGEMPMKPGGAEAPAVAGARASAARIARGSRSLRIDLPSDPSQNRKSR